MSVIKKPHLVGHKREFFCTTCHPTGAPSMTPAECKEHMVKVHNVTEIAGNRTLVMALDGDFYSNTFEWTLGGVKFTEVSSGPARHH